MTVIVPSWMTAEDVFVMEQRDGVEVVRAEPARTLATATSWR